MNDSFRLWNRTAKTCLTTAALPPTIAVALQVHLKSKSNMALHANTGSSCFLLAKSSPYCRNSNCKNELRFSKIIGEKKFRSIGVVYCSSDNSASNGTNNSNNKKGGGGVPNSNYVVPLNKTFSSSNSSCITRPLAEILRDLNKRIPDNIINPPHSSTLIPWYHANRMLSFYAPGWCGEVRDVIFSENGSVTVVYRVTIRGSDGEAHRETTGTVLSSDSDIVDPVAAAEEIAFCKACARFGLGLYLYHEE